MPELTLLETGLKEIDAQLSLLPKGKKGALVFAVDNKGARIGVAARINDEWMYSVGLDQTFEKRAPTIKLIVSRTW